MVHKCSSLIGIVKYKLICIHIYLRLASSVERESAISSRIPDKKPNYNSRKTGGASYEIQVQQVATEVDVRSPCRPNIAE